LIFFFLRFWILSGLSKLSIVVVVGILIVAIAAAAYSLSNFNTSPGNQYLSQCVGNHEPSTTFTNTSQLETFSADTLAPGAIAKFCVAYGMSSSHSFQLPLTNESSILYANNLSLVPSGLLRVSAEPNSVTVPAFSDQSGPNTVTYAVFTVSTSNSSKGFYVLSFPGFCLGMPLVVGYAQVNFSAFEYWYDTPNLHCVDTTYGGGSVVSTTDNVGVAYTSVPLADQKYPNSIE
jgi:hypothetical protein